jgi:hypothetical protein
MIAKAGRYALVGLISVVGAAAWCGAKAQPQPEPKKVYKVCHGEIESVCKKNDYNTFERCSRESGVGGADPAISCQFLCGKSRGPRTCEVETIAQPIDGNFCGYSWFKVSCY